MDSSLIIRADHARSLSIERDYLCFVTNFDAVLIALTFSAAFQRDKDSRSHLNIGASKNYHDRSANALPSYSEMASRAQH